MRVSGGILKTNGRPLKIYILKMRILETAEIAIFGRTSLMFGVENETSSGRISSIPCNCRLLGGFLDALGPLLQRYITIGKVPQMAGNVDFWSALPGIL